MADEEKPAEQGTAGASPAPEELKPQDETAASSLEQRPNVVTQAAKRRRAAYKPGHKATFVGLAVVALILLVNAGVLWFILRGQEEAQKKEQESVTLSADNLSKLGVSRNAVDPNGILLTINPDAKFGGEVTIAGDTSIGGKLDLNGDFSATSASFADLQGGDTAVDSLNVNGDATISNLDLREKLTVQGDVDLQGRLTANSLVTINNNLNISGNLSVGGAVSYDTLDIKDIRLTGHFRTSGNNPSVSAGPAAGGSGTASGNGNDVSGTINVGVGVGSSAGVLASLTFKSEYSSTPQVVVTAVGRSAGAFYITRTTTGFSIYAASALGFGGYSFDYIVFE